MATNQNRMILRKEIKWSYFGVSIGRQKQRRREYGIHVLIRGIEYGRQNRVGGFILIEGLV